MEPLHRSTQHDPRERLAGDHLQVVEGRLRPDVEATVERSVERRLIPVHAVRVDPRVAQGRHELALAAFGVEDAASDPRTGGEGFRPPPLRPGSRTGYRARRQSGGAVGGCGRLEVLDVVDDDVEHARHRPGELDDLGDDEPQVPRERLADRTLHEPADRLVRRCRHRDVDIGSTVDQRERLAESRLPVESDRGELGEELVELALESCREVPGRPSPPDLGVDLRHHLCEVGGVVGRCDRATFACGRRAGGVRSDRLQPRGGRLD